ncbi:MAG: hypothetical protein ACXADY_19125 [Candidatus Hodarchaeales archaeon]
MRKINNDRYLKASFLIGGIYNLLSGIILLLFWDSLSSFFEAQRPNPIFIQITALFLIVVGYFLVYAAQNPRELVIIGVGSVTTRLGYFLITLVTFISQDIEILYLLFGIFDAFIAIIILIPLVLTEGVSWQQLWRF